MGTELSKPRGGHASAAAAAAGSAVEAPTQVLAAKWHAWLQDAETLYLRGRFGAYQEVNVFELRLSPPVCLALLLTLEI